MSMANFFETNHDLLFRFCCFVLFFVFCFLFSPIDWKTRLHFQTNNRLKSKCQSKRVSSSTASLTFNSTTTHRRVWQLPCTILSLYTLFSIDCSQRQSCARHRSEARFCEMPSYTRRLQSAYRFATLSSPRTFVIDLHTNDRFASDRAIVEPLQSLLHRAASCPSHRIVRLVSNRSVDQFVQKHFQLKPFLNINIDWNVTQFLSSQSIIFFLEKQTFEYERVGCFVFSLLQTLVIETNEKSYFWIEDESKKTIQSRAARCD